jgi:hypothetical protein
VESEPGKREARHEGGKEEGQNQWIQWPAGVEVLDVRGLEGQAENAESGDQKV